MSRDPMMTSSSLRPAGSSSGELHRPQCQRDAGLAAEFTAFAVGAKSALDKKTTGNDMQPDVLPEVAVALEHARDAHILVDDFGGFRFHGPADVWPNRFVSQHIEPPQSGDVERVNGNKETGIVVSDRKAEGSVCLQRKSLGPLLARQAVEHQSGTSNRNDVKPQPTALAADNLATHFHPGLNPRSDQTLPQLAGPTASQKPELMSSPMKCSSVHVEALTRNAKGAVTHIELALEPAELGRINARLEFGNDRLVLIVSAENLQIAEALAADSGLLLRALGAHIGGIETVAVVIQQEGQAGVMDRASTFNDAEFGSPHHEPMPTEKHRRYAGDNDPILSKSSGENDAISARVLI